jgi:MFS family permease
MLKDLQLTINNRYSLITLIFFIPYVLFQPPATVILRKIGPRRFLSAIVVFWGATMIVSIPKPLMIYVDSRC